MIKGKIGIGLMVLFSMALAVTVASLAQAAGGPGGAGGAGGAGGGRFGGGGGRGGFGNMDPAQMRQMMLQRYKDALGATDEEWTVIEPKLDKVTVLSRDLRAGGRGGFGRGGRGGNAPAATPATPPTEVEKATTDLQTALDNPQADPKLIKDKLTALRTAREKVRQQLDKASADLKAVLSVRQEAQLVMMGIVD